MTLPWGAEGEDSLNSVRSTLRSVKLINFDSIAYATEVIFHYRNFFSDFTKLSWFHLKLYPELRPNACFKLITMQKKKRAREKMRVKLASQCVWEIIFIRAFSTLIGTNGHQRGGRK